MTAGTVVATGDTTASTQDSQYTTVPVYYNGKKVPVRVANNDPYAHAPSSSTETSDGKYHPDQYSFNKTSAFADKSFDAGVSDLVKSDPEFTDTEHNQYATKAYGDPTLAGTVQGLSSKSHFTTVSESSRSVSGLDKPYAATADADSDLLRPAALPASNVTDVQNQAAQLGDSHTADLLAEYSMAHKQYLGPGAQHVEDGVEIKDNVILTRMSTVPNRPLTIDEVRNLINHGTKPDLNQAHPDESKPLNAPDYKPEPLRDNPSPGATSSPGLGKWDVVPVSSTPSEDDKDDPVPAPGTMGATPAPENSEPLPQH